MNKREKFGKTLQVVASVAVCAILFGMLTGRTRAAESAEYASPTFGYTVSWDDTIWSNDDSPLPPDADGVQLDSTYSYALIAGTAWQNVDTEACLAKLKDVWNNPKNASNFRMASRGILLPESPLGGDRILYTTTMQDTDGPTDLMVYTECLSIDDDQAALMVSLITTEDAYESQLPVWSDLLASVDLRGADSTSDGDRSDGSVDDGERASGSTYADPAGYTVAYDDAVWTGKPWDDNSGTGIQLEGANSFGYVKAVPADGTLAECPATIASQLEANPSFKLVRKADESFERPELSDGAVGELYTMNAADATNKFAVYVECRELDADTTLLITFFSDVNDYATESPDWQTVLDGIQTGDSTGQDDGDTASQHPPAGPASGNLGKQD